MGDDAFDDHHDGDKAEEHKPSQAGRELEVDDLLASLHSHSGPAAAGAELVQARLGQGVDESSLDPWLKICFFLLHVFYHIL